ncbi:uncharacterized protein LOC119381059 [Rhipicephalus sanguineus]|uniref:uncharacterized protein LOC119381059 n=1 Tax=Rhipicephalus sanguineus TaxID=34632 RepID=UPI001893DF9C|nr:uncharacterized protein LOC119381059 [Rhipicephalus sanguineus]
MCEVKLLEIVDALVISSTELGICRNPKSPFALVRCASSYSQSSAQDMPLKNDDSSVVSPGIQTQLPTAHHVETPYYGNFTTTVFDSSILSQPAHTEQGLLSTPPPSSYDYVSAPSFTYGAPSPDVLCSSPQNGVLSPGVTPHACATDATLPYGQEVVAVQQPLQQPQQHLVASYSPVPFTNLLFSCEPPAPTVNWLLSALMTQRAVTFPLCLLASNCIHFILGDISVHNE